VQGGDVCLDELVPEDDRYRRLDRLVDCVVREVAAPYYPGMSQPSIDPVVLVKLMVAVRWRDRLDAGSCCGRRACVSTSSLSRYGLGERLPVHQTLSARATRRFVDAALLSVCLCARWSCASSHGWSRARTSRSTAFHAEADAALASLRASLAS